MLYLILFFIGMSNALPLPLTGSTLSIWLTEAGFSKELIGTYALIGIPFSLKILWSPIIDQIPPPFFRRSPRKGWLLFALLGITLSLLLLSLVSPVQQPWILAGCLSLLLFFSSCLYIVGITYEIESLEESRYGMGSFYVLSGYRIGLLCAGSGVLFLSSVLDWSAAIQVLSAFVGLGAIFVSFQSEPFKSKDILKNKQTSFSKYPHLFSGFWHETIQQPCRLFFQKSNWLTILFLLFTFKLGDHMAKSMEGPFYLSLGFTKAELATASKLWGMAATILGAFLAGKFVKGKDPEIPLVRIGLIHALSLACYYLMALAGKSLFLLYFTTTIEHFTGGAAMTIFIYFLWKTCNILFSAIQYALLWSLFIMKSDLFAFFGGILASSVSWSTFFLIVMFVGIFTAALSYVLAIYWKESLGLKSKIFLEEGMKN